MNAEPKPSGYYWSLRVDYEGQSGRGEEAAIVEVRCDGTVREFGSYLSMDQRHYRFLHDKPLKKPEK